MRSNSPIQSPQVLHEMKLSLRPKSELISMAVHYCGRGRLLASAGTNLYTGDTAGRKLQRIAQMPMSRAEQVVEVVPVFQRLLRGGIKNVLSLDDKSVLVVDHGRMHRLGIHDRSIRLVHELPRGRRPLTYAFSKDGKGVIYYGEYWSNPAREAVRVWRSEDGNCWEIAYTFPPSAIRHVHAVQYDPFTNYLWIATGDLDDECQIAFSEHGLRWLQPIGQGSQTWRTVSLVFTEDALYWGTDDPGGHNYIYRWKRADGFLEKVAWVKGPVYYSKKVGDYLLFSTAVERGEGDQDGYARIYAVDKDLNCQEVYRLAKDRWHPVFFGYGVLEFARGDTDGESFWVTARGLVGGQRSILFRLKT
jgi:hypothetical protein